MPVLAHLCVFIHLFTTTYTLFVYKLLNFCDFYQSFSCFRVYFFCLLFQAGFIKCQSLLSVQKRSPAASVILQTTSVLLCCFVQAVFYGVLNKVLIITKSSLFFSNCTYRFFSAPALFAAIALMRARVFVISSPAPRLRRVSFSVSTCSSVTSCGTYLS